MPHAVLTHSRTCKAWQWAHRPACVQREGALYTRIQGAQMSSTHRHSAVVQETPLSASLAGPPVRWQPQTTSLGTFSSPQVRPCLPCAQGMAEVDHSLPGSKAVSQEAVEPNPAHCPMTCLCTDLWAEVPAGDKQKEAAPWEMLGSML